MADNEVNIITHRGIHYFKTDSRFKLAAPGLMRYGHILSKMSTAVQEGKSHKPKQNGTRIKIRLKRLYSRGIF